MIVPKYKAINTCAKIYSDRSFDGSKSYCCSIHLQSPSISLWWHHKRAPPDTAPSSCTASVQPSPTQLEGTCSHYLSSSWRRKSLEKEFQNIIFTGKIRPHFPLYFFLYKQIYQIYAESCSNLSINRNSFYKITKIQ